MNFSDAHLFELRPSSEGSELVVLTALLSCGGRASKRLGPAVDLLESWSAWLLPPLVESPSGAHFIAVVEMKHCPILPRWICPVKHV